MKIYLDADSDVRLIRRMRRDISERGRDMESVIKQYEMSVIPMYSQYVLPQQNRSDLVLDCNGAVHVDVLVQAVLDVIEDGQG